MNNFTKMLIGLLLLVAANQAASAQKKVKLSEKKVLKTMKEVADWQLANPTGKGLNTWEYGPFYAGLMKLYEASEDEKYLNAIKEMGETVNWEPRARPYDANVLAISQVFIELFEMTKDTSMIDKSRFVMDSWLIRWLEPEVHFEGNKYWWEWWTWCDALFMAPPAFAQLSAALGEPKYLAESDKLWWLTSDYLYSTTDSLYFRDDRFFKQKSANGAKIFWSRGNGWVVSGLARVLDYLPKDHPSRKKYEAQFKEMAYKIKNLQMDNGFWGQSLLDQENFPQKETSGTAFFVQAMAWGINQGLLPKEEFMPAISKGWGALITAIHPSGKLGFVQEVGHEPTDVDYDDTESYGSGALLLAGFEICELVGK